jgi:type II secretory pathway component PulK
MRRPGELQRGASVPGRIRSGTALIVAIVALVLVTAICFSLVRITLAATDQAQRQHWRRQSLWLAESALGRAIVQLRDDPAFSGDEWNISLPTETGEVQGRVKVDITAAAGSPQETTIKATAQFPRHPTVHVRITRTYTFPSR